MNARKAGSGLHKLTASAVEQLVAAVFVGGDRRAALTAIEQQVAKDRCGVDPTVLSQWLRQLADTLGLDVVEAETPSPDQLGDVRLTLADGTYRWIEVKAQTTKRFSDLIQADWVRDETDAIRWLMYHNPDFHGLCSAWVRDSLEMYNPTRHFGDWSFEGLWLADLGLLYNSSRRKAAGAVDMTSLIDFLGRKYVLHVTVDGVRCTALANLDCVHDLAAGGTAKLDIAAGGAANSRVWVSTGAPPKRGAFDFVYYTGYESLMALGRHKLTDYALQRASGLIVLR